MKVLPSSPASIAGCSGLLHYGILQDSVPALFRENICPDRTRVSVFIHLLTCLCFSLLSVQALTSAPTGAGTGVTETWNDRRMKREALKSFHQEFEISRTFKIGQHEQASKSSAVLDGAAAKWREPSISGASGRVTVFEERAVVQMFLAEHVHRYSIALTIENEIPEPYRIGLFPTYIVMIRRKLDLCRRRRERLFRTSQAVEEGRTRNGLIFVARRTDLDDGRA